MCREEVFETRLLVRRPGTGTHVVTVEETLPISRCAARCSTRCASSTQVLDAGPGVLEEPAQPSPRAGAVRTRESSPNENGARGKEREKQPTQVFDHPHIVG